MHRPRTPSSRTTSPQTADSDSPDRTEGDIQAEVPGAVGPLGGAGHRRAVDVGHDRRGQAGRHELHAGVRVGHSTRAVEAGRQCAGVDVGVNVGADPALAEQFDQPSTRARSSGCPQADRAEFALVEVVS